MQVHSATGAVWEWQFYRLIISSSTSQLESSGHCLQPATLNIAFSSSRSNPWPLGCQESERKVKVLVAQSCPTLCDPMDCSPPGSSVSGMLQARILEWVAMPSSRGSSQCRDQTWVSCIAGRFFMIWATGEETARVITFWCHGTFLCWAPSSCQATSPGQCPSQEALTLASSHMATSGLPRESESWFLCLTQKGRDETQSSVAHLSLSILCSVTSWR